jgi:hypothetical protein
MIPTSTCRAFGEGAIITYFNVLRLTRPAQAGLKLITSQMLSDSATTIPFMKVIRCTRLYDPEAYGSISILQTMFPYYVMLRP